MEIDITNISLKAYEDVIKSLRLKCQEENDCTIRLGTGEESVRILIDPRDNYRLSGYSNGHTMNFINYNYEKYVMCSFQNVFRYFQSHTNQNTDDFKIAKSTVIFCFSEAARSEIIFKYCKQNLTRLDNKAFDGDFKQLITSYGHVISLRDNNQPRYFLPLQPFDYYRYYTSDRYTGNTKDALELLDRVCRMVGIRMEDLR